MYVYPHTKSKLSVISHIHCTMSDCFDFLPCDTMRTLSYKIFEVLSLPSPGAICLSVCHVDGLYPDGWRYRQTFFLAW